MISPKMERRLVADETYTKVKGVHQYAWIVIFDRYS